MLTNDFLRYLESLFTSEYCIGKDRPNPQYNAHQRSILSKQLELLV